MEPATGFSAAEHCWSEPVIAHPDIGSDDTAFRYPAARDATLLLGIVGLVLFTLGLGNQEFVGFDVRFALFAKEMLRNGPSLFPTTYDQPYPDYPALSTLLIWLLAQIFHVFNKLVAVLPTALASAMTLALSYRLVSPYSVRWGVLTVCFELLTVTFLVEARSISLDQMLTTVTLAGFFLVYRHHHLQPFSQPALYRLAVGGLLVLGFCLRGPLGLVLPSGVICGFYLVDRNWRALVAFGTGAAALLLACFAGLYYSSLLAGGADFASQVVWMQALGRLGSLGSKPFYYYFTSGFGYFALSFLPALLVILALLPRWWRRQTDPNLRLCLHMAVWIAVIAVGLSIPEAKKARYLLPLTPPLAVLASYPFVATGDAWLGRILWGLRALLTCMPALLLVTLVYGFYQISHRQLAIRLDAGDLVLLLLCCHLLLMLALWLPLEEAQRDMVLAVVSVVAIYSTLVRLYEPLNIELYRSRDFVEHLAAARERQPAPVVLFRMGRDSLANQVLVNSPDTLNPEFVADSDSLERLSPPFYLVIADKYTDDLAAVTGAPPPPAVAGTFHGEPYRFYYFPPAAAAGTAVAPVSPQS